MKNNPKRLGEQMNTLVQVWTALNPTKSYSALSLHELRTGFQPCFDARARVTAAQSELATAINERDMADQAAFKLYKRALSSIKADPSEGDEGPMFRALISGMRKPRRNGVIESVPTSPTALTVAKPAA